MSQTTASASDSLTTPLAPGAWLGLLGGGQLGRMFCHAAQSLGYRVAVLDPAEDSPAGVVADLYIRAAYDDVEALDRLAALCPAVTTEFENVPADSLRRLASKVRVSPSADAVAVAQDRNAEKAFITSLGLSPAGNLPVRSAADLDQVSDALLPGILKAARLGYDGKGQARVSNRDELRSAYAAFGDVECVLEALLPLAFELSVVVARGFDGEAVTYPVSQNVHHDGILAVSTAPAPALAEGGDGCGVPAEALAGLTRQATDAALAIARGLDYHGVLCVEFFVLRDGSLVVNEIAPRPHNSGHYTINACVASQFEQQARVLAGLPLGATRQVAPSVMLNLLGDVWFDAQGAQREPDWAGVVGVPEAALHLYGKRDARLARKMGHVTCLGATPADALAAARRVAQVLGLPNPEGKA